MLAVLLAGCGSASVDGVESDDAQSVAGDNADASAALVGDPVAALITVDDLTGVAGSGWSVNESPEGRMPAEPLWTSTFDTSTCESTEDQALDSTQEAVVSFSGPDGESGVEQYIEVFSSEQDAHAFAEYRDRFSDAAVACEGSITPLTENAEILDGSSGGANQEVDGLGDEAWLYADPAQPSSVSYDVRVNNAWFHLGAGFPATVDGVAAGRNLAQLTIDRLQPTG